MSKEERTTAIIAAALGIAAILLIWWMRGSTASSDVLPAATTTVPATTIAGTSANNPGYVSYNIPGFDPGALPSLINNVTGGTTNIGAGCCPGCAGTDDTTNQIGEYQAISGLGNFAGSGSGFAIGGNTVAGGTLYG